MSSRQPARYKSRRVDCSTSLPPPPPQRDSAAVVGGGTSGGVERFAHGSRTTMFRPVGSALPSIDTEENSNTNATTVVAQSMSSGVVRVVSANTVFV
ncbi:hypothetical protein ACI65C_010793 [Semiaphis heraclei]